MFCPGCGTEDKQVNQFCRACGADLRVVRTAVARPDSITSTANAAREEIGRSIAAKIRETQSAGELKKVAEDVLPEIEKFLESPEERRLRRLRVGTILACIGFGVAISLWFLGVAMGDQNFLFLAALGGVTFFIGVAFWLNGLLLSVPKREVYEMPASERAGLAFTEEQQPDPLLPEARSNVDPLFSTPGSVTENTTRHLTEKES
jgi:hypothetical protein